MQTPVQIPAMARLQSSTSSTTLSSGGVRWNWGNILDSADSQTGSSQGSQSGLTTWTWGLGLGTTSSSDLDVDSGNTNFLTLDGNVLGSQHSSVWRGLISVSLDLHTTSDSGDSFLTGKVGNVDEGIVERGEDTSNTEDLRTVWSVSIWFEVGKALPRNLFFFKRLGIMFDGNSLS